METHYEMKKTLKRENFLNLHDLICEDAMCPVFDDKSKLLSYDGSHFTKNGAKYIGNLITKNNIFNEIFVDNQ